MKTRYVKALSFGCLALVLLLSSCGRYVYRPTTVKPSLFSQKGDFEVSLNAFNMGELHGAVAITDHIAISGTRSWGGRQADTSYRRDSAGNINSMDTRHYKSGDKELALGWYSYMPESKTCFEVFAGGATYQRKVRSNYYNYLNPALNNESNYSDNRYRRFFLQPAFGHIGKYYDIMFANRFSWITYQSDDQRDFISESMLIARLGYKNVKFMWQVGFTIDFNDGRYDYFPLTFGFGLNIVFNRSWKNE